MNSKSHSTDSGSVTSKILRRTAATVAGLAMAIGGFMAASPARADVDNLDVSVTPGVNTADIHVSNCNENSAGVIYSIESATGEMTNAGAAVTDWNQASTFTFTESGLALGTYTVYVTCLGYSGSEDQTGSAEFTLGGQGYDAEVTVSPSTWKSGDQVTLRATNMHPGSTATFAFGYSGHVTANEWTATVDDLGNASVTVTWPSTYQGQPLQPGEHQVWVTTSAGDGSDVVKVWLGANSQWSLTKPTGTTGTGGHGGGTLPSTGN